MNEQMPSRESRRFAGAAFVAAVLVALVLVNVIINALAARFSWYLYTEERYEHTIGNAADAVLRDVPDGKTVKVLFCMAEDKMEADTVYALVLNTFRQLEARYDFIEIDFVNIYLRPDLVAPFRETAEEGIKNTITEQSVILVSGEDRKNYRVENLQSFFVLDGEQRITAYNGEEIAVSCVAWVLAEHHPLAGFTVGHGENQSDLLAFYTALVASGYEIRLLDLNEDIPEGMELIVIANPRWDFLRGAEGSGVESELDRLEAFLADGGALFVSLDPYAKAPLNGLRAFLAERGLAATQDVIRDPQNSITTDGYTLVTEFAPSAFGGAITARLGAFGTSRAIVREASVLSLLSVDGYTVEPILLSSAASQSYRNGVMTSGDGSFPVLAVSKKALDGGKTETVFLSSSVYFLANDVMNSAIYANRDVVLASIEKASGNPTPVGCDVLSIEQSRLEDLTMGEARLYTLLVAVVAPLVVSAVGIFIIVRRKIR